VTALHPHGKGDARAIDHSDAGMCMPTDRALPEPPPLIDQLCAALGPELAPVVDAEGRVVEVRRVRAEVRS
jgi:hypothetical protein